MPIGKNAIKRVSNNGYSNVKTTAPDMENSVVEKAVKPAAKKSTSSKKAPAAKSVAAKNTTKKSAEAPAKAVKKSAPKATAEKKTMPKKSMESEPELRPVRTLEKVTEKTEKQSEGYVNLGKELPNYLL